MVGSFEKMWQEIIEETDNDGDGEINYEEFRAAMGKIIVSG